MKGKVELERYTEVEISRSILEAEIKETVYSFCQQFPACEKDMVSLTSLLHG